MNGSGSIELTIWNDVLWDNPDLKVIVDGNKITNAKISDDILNEYFEKKEDKESNTNEGNKDDNLPDGIYKGYSSYYCTAKVAINTWGQNVRDAIRDKIVLTSSEIDGHYDLYSIIDKYQNDTDKISVAFNKLGEDNKPQGSYGTIKVNIELRDVEGFEIEEEEENTLNVKGSAIETVDTITGMILEPLIDLLTFIADSIMSITTHIMTEQPVEPVMKTDATLDATRTGVVGSIGKFVKNILASITGNVTGTSTTGNIDGDAATTETTSEGITMTLNMDNYRNAFNQIKYLKYPNFKYSPEEIFLGNIDLLSIDFITGNVTDYVGIRENKSSGWNSIRKTISTWYQVLRYIALIGLLSVLIYTGIKLILSANSRDKAKYKERIVNWFVAVILLYGMHYLMAFIVTIVQNITSLFGSSIGKITVVAGDMKFDTNMLGLARFQLQQQAFSKQIFSLIIYIALVTFTLKFTITYLRRMLNMAFLTLIAPIVALTYPIDKMNGQARGFQMWLKDYIYNSLLQPLHYFLYLILINSCLTLAANNPLYAIVALLFMEEAEKLLKQIFGFQRARMGTVGGLAGAMRTVAITNMLTNVFKNPFFGDKGPGGKIGSGSEKGSNLFGGYGDVEPLDFDEDDYINMSFLYGNGDGFDRNSIFSNFNKEDYIFNFRNSISQDDLNNLRWKNELDFGGIFDNLKSIFSKLKMGGFGTEETETLKFDFDEYQRLFNVGIEYNEAQFKKAGIAFQYNDTYAGISSKDLFSKMMTAMQNGDNDQVQEYFDILNNRMKQNHYINNAGGPSQIIEKERRRQRNQRNNSNTESPRNMGIEGNENNEGTIGNKYYMPERQSFDDEFNNENSRENQNNRHNENGVDNKNNRNEKNSILNDIKETGEKVVNSPVALGVRNVAREFVKPVYDTQKDLKYNGKKIAKNIAKGAAGTVLGVTAAAVQAGISITDGKYNPMEAVTTFSAGAKAGGSLVGKGINAIEDRGKRNISENEKKLLKQKSEEWYNSDSAISSYNTEYGNNAKNMRKRVRDRYIEYGVTDFEDQKQALNYADYLMRKGKVSTTKEADKLAIATLKYRQELIESGNYYVMIDTKKREQYLKAQTKYYSGSHSLNSVKRMHENFIGNVKEFDKINNN